MNGPSPRAVRSREKLLRAATDLLVEAGPRGVTVDAVAEVSGVAKSTLYRQWGSRDEMLVDVVRCNMPEPGDADLSGGFETALRSYMAAGAVALADPEWSRILPALLSLRTSMPELAAVVDADRSTKRVVLQSIIALGVAEAALPEAIDIDDATILLFGPLVFATITDQQHRLDHLAGYVTDRFIQSYRP